MSLIPKPLNLAPVPKIIIFYLIFKQEENEKLKAQLAGGKIDINDIKQMRGNENLSKEGKFSQPKLNI